MCEALCSYTCVICMQREDLEVGSKQPGFTSSDLAALGYSLQHNLSILLSYLQNGFNGILLEHDFKSITTDIYYVSYMPGSFLSATDIPASKNASSPFPWSHSPNWKYILVLKSLRWSTTWESIGAGVLVHIVLKQASFLLLQSWPSSSVIAGASITYQFFFSSWNFIRHLYLG